MRLMSLKKRKPWSASRTCPQTASNIRSSRPARPSPRPSAANSINGYNEAHGQTRSQEISQKCREKARCDGAGIEDEGPPDALLGRQAAARQSLALPRPAGGGVEWHRALARAHMEGARQRLAQPSPARRQQRDTLDASRGGLPRQDRPYLHRSAVFLRRGLRAASGTSRTKRWNSIKIRRHGPITLRADAIHRHLEERHLPTIHVRAPPAHARAPLRPGQHLLALRLAQKPSA